MGQAESTEAPSGSTQAEELLIKSLPSALVIVGPSGVGASGSSLSLGAPEEIQCSDLQCLMEVDLVAAGKGTLINKLMEEAGGAYGFSCSHTTRKPREGEVVSGGARPCV